jgi:magnesium chelatase subunit I
MAVENIQNIRTIGELRSSGYTVRSVKDEMRSNLIQMLKEGTKLFEGILGYEDTVIPALVNALLSRHDIILLGLRGQAKTRLVRMLPQLLDEYTPIIAGSELNENPFQPISKFAVDLVEEHGDATEIEWIPREQRYGEKLATPDVTIADLIGDIDPIKAAVQRLHYSHEGAIHFGLIPRTNRGIFSINELPDLQPRIQVGLFNIMQEKDIQIRGFNVRIPLDVMVVFTANPEDYTNRGNIITPLKDRIDSQILTHYPEDIQHAIGITEQEAWTTRNGTANSIPFYFKEIIEQIAFHARDSEFVDQKSGVSARLPISAIENLVSNAERRSIICDDPVIMPRISDLLRILPAMTGKLELVYEGEQEGTATVSKLLIGKAVRSIFGRYFPDPLGKKKQRDSTSELSKESTVSSGMVFGSIISWFEQGNALVLTDEMPFKDYFTELRKIDGLEEFSKDYMKLHKASDHEIASAMEFVLEGLHQHSRIAKSEAHGSVSYKDMVGTLFTQISGDDDDNQY